MKYQYTVQEGLVRIKTNTRKYIFSGLAIALMIGGVSAPAFASSNEGASASGEVGYTAYTTVQRHAEFNVRQSSKDCESSHSNKGEDDRNKSEDSRASDRDNCANVCTTVWNVGGAWVVNVNLSGNNYPENLVLVQTGTSLTGTIDVLGGGSLWTFTTGSVNGNTFDLQGYFNNSPSWLIHFSGTIAANGTISGDWNDITVGGRVGTWASTSGVATQSVVGCAGKGSFEYSDKDHNHYKVDVKYVNISGKDVWFAGPVVSGNAGAGEWLFVKAHDGGKSGHDLIWGSFTTETSAKLGVATMGTPADGPFSTTSGNIRVND